MTCRRLTLFDSMSSLYHRVARDVFFFINLHSVTCQRIANVHLFSLFIFLLFAPDNTFERVSATYIHIYATTLDKTDRLLSEKETEREFVHIHTGLN